MLSNQTFDKTHSVKQSLFTQAMGAGTMRMAPAKIGMQQNKFSTVKSLPAASKSSTASSLRAGQKTSIIMSASKNDNMFQINSSGSDFYKFDNSTPQQSSYNQLFTPASSSAVPSNSW